MRKINLKRLKIKTRIALVYSIFVVIIGIGMVFFLNLGVQVNIQNKPLIYKIAPNSIQVTINELPKDSSNLLGITGVIPGLIREYNTSQFNNMLSADVFQRIAYISAFTILGGLILSFLISYFLSKKLLKPLTSMADMTNYLTFENPGFRLRTSEADDELMQLTEAFNNTLDRVQDSYKNMEQFNAYASHELRNSLAVLRTRLEVDSKEGDYKQAVSFAISQVDSISKTVNDILALSSRDIKGEIEPVDLALTSAQAADEYAVMGRKIELELPEEGVPYVLGREVWFHRAISNLIDNALKHTPEGYPIHIAVRQCFGAVIVTVQDRGPGIDEDKQGSIWEPYYSSSSFGKGYGLGLAMVKHVVDICGGIVWVKSQKGSGSTFYISLPSAAGC